MNATSQTPTQDFDNTPPPAGGYRCVTCKDWRTLTIGPDPYHPDAEIPCPDCAPAPAPLVRPFVAALGTPWLPGSS